MVEDHCGHKISKICMWEILVTRLNIFWNSELWSIYPKWRPKLLPVPVLTSDSCSTTSTWSKTNIISRGSLWYFLRYLRPKFTNLKKFKRVTNYRMLQFFDILRPLSSSIAVPNFSKIVSQEISQAPFKVFGLSFFRPHFRPNFLRPTLTANISGKVRLRKLKFAAKVDVPEYYRPP